MKQLQRLAIVLVVLVLATCVVIGCAACTQDKTYLDTKGTAVILVKAAEDGAAPQKYEVNLAKVSGDEGLVSVLDYLKKTKDLAYTMESSEFGAFLTQVNSIAQDATKGEYLYVYTTVQEDYDVSAYASNVTVDGITFTNSGVGASTMHIKDGSTIYIGIVKW